ncbi:ABC transporter permease [Rhodoligotrophos defluvii]|uniref:ABC transporter permease n=1 Tax=Rhodoligotrophos defluvii TaxID=2561934 RepID=UPI0010C949C0|nr:ABC transporter permease [Rhodoligotrophos defluvii]
MAATDTLERIGPARRVSADILARLTPTGWIGLVVIALYVLVAVTAPLWAPYPADAVLTGEPFARPSLAHLLGTDGLGRDVFSRVVLGSTAVLSMMFAATSLAVAAGSLIGIALGYLRGWLDEAVTRLIDIVISIPPLIFGLLVITALSNSPLHVVLVVAFLFTPRVVRVVRAATFSIATQDYIAAAQARGESIWAICTREILPNVAGTILVEFAIRSGFVIIFIGSLGFLGFGAPPPTPEWGLMINEGRSDMSMSLWPVLSPAIAMAILVVAINLFTDNLARILARDAPVARSGA